MNPTWHFNQLSEAETERLAILAEECAEVIQVVGKILRHGYESHNPKSDNSESNRQMLTLELGDLRHSIARMETAGDIDADSIKKQSAYKAGSIFPYLHHQEAL